MTNSLLELTDEELEEYVGDGVSIDIVREILEKPGVVDINSIEEDEFAQWWAYALEGYIDADEDTPEWKEAYDNNYDWGYEIAKDINRGTGACEYLEDEE